MDSKTFNSNTTLTTISAKEYNEKTLYIRVPTIIYLSILMPFGILGNASVFYIYGFRLKKSNVQFFIVLLALFDTVSSTIGMPLELSEILYMHFYMSSPLCKVQRLVNYAGSIGSALVLFSISLERYIKVCRPMNKQMTEKHSKIIGLIILIISVPLAIPFAVAYDRLTVQVEQNITVYQCALRYSPAIFAYYSCFLPTCLLNLVVMFILYSFVLRTARRHFKQVDNRHQAISESVETDRKFRGRKLSRTSMSVICLTVVYAISFTPTLVTGMVTKFYSKVDYSPTVRGMLILLYRSWAVNCSTNPIIFGFFNKAYRDAFLSLMAKLLCLQTPTRRRSKETATTSALDSSCDGTETKRGNIESRSQNFSNGFDS